MNTATNDIYTRVTNQIIAAIEAGANEWQMPWHRTDSWDLFPTNAHTKKPYRGVNVLSLWARAQELHYPSGVWGTYRQWAELGAQVRKDEKASPVVFWKASDKTAEAEDDEAERGTRLFAKHYCVFNVAQVDGFTPAEAPELPPPADRIERADAFFRAVGVDIRHGGNVAYYRPDSDYIQMPWFEAFPDPIGYYAILAHEAIHWTGATHRLGRDLGARFGIKAQAMEELIAELGAAFLCGSLQLSNEPRPDHAAYLASWLQVLRSDKRAIFTAASKAQQAVDWMQEWQAPRGSTGMVRPMPEAEPQPKPKTDDVQEGDIVAYSKRFLRSIGVYTGDMPQARGKVTALVPLGPESTLAEIEWGSDEIPRRVNIKNLCKVGSVAFYD